MEDVRTCPICRADKPLDQYYVRHKRTSHTGAVVYQHGCKTCRRQLTEAWQAAHPERTKAISRKAARNYYATHKTTVARRKKDVAASDPEAARAKWRAGYRRRRQKLQETK